MGPIQQNTKLGYKNSVKGKKCKTKLARQLTFFCKRGFFLFTDILYFGARLSHKSSSRRPINFIVFFIRS